MANKIALITDSTSDIPEEWRTQFDITIIPLTIVWNESQFLDGIDISAEEFYQRLGKDSIHPTTSQPTPQSFSTAYQDAANKGYDEILVITISSAMSGTILSARQAAENSPIPVHIVDGKSNSMGLGWQVIAAARARDSGADLNTILSIIEKVRTSLAYYISLDTMDYLIKGGRIGDAVKFLNSVIKIRPLILVNHESGTVGASIPARSRSGAIDGLFKQFFKNINSNLPLHITVLHNAAYDEAKELADRVINTYHPKEIFISIVSPILGVHTGPRAIALCGYAGDY
ncbi:MAG: DegV family protein [Anaerolineaceae bacterium]|nr:DegV family protein [Anaerolineaceae bacterium]